MKVIRVYRNKDCARCEKFARAHKFLDWLNRVDTSTEDPACGPMAMGEIVVEDLKTGEILHGVDAVRKIYWQIPAYWVLLPLLRIPAIARYVDREVRGCVGDSCAVH